MYKGFYINLDRSADRRARMEQQLRRTGRAEIYARSAAIDAEQQDIPDVGGLKKGEVACFLSHFQTIEAARACGQHLHIAEDDAIFPDDIVERIEMIVASDAFEQYDLFFTETIIPLSADYLQEYQRIYKENTHAKGAIDFSAVEAKGMYRASASSYVVNRNSADRLARLVEAELAEGPRYPFDIFLRTLIDSDRLRAAIIVPFLTAVAPDDAVQSTIGDRSQEKDSIMAMTLLRTLFYKDCDAGSLLATIKKTLTSDDGDREQAIAQLMKFGVFGNYKAF